MKYFIAFIIVLVLLVVAFIVFSGRGSEEKLPEITPLSSLAPPSPSQEQTPAIPLDEGGSEGVIEDQSNEAAPIIVRMTANGFEPSEITVKVGETVTFLNTISRPAWPASGVHPTHRICPGFDALHGLQKDETYEIAFNQAKECPMHDHLRPSARGKITVIE